MIIRDSLTHVFYSLIKDVARVSNLSGRLADLHNFLDDLIKVRNGSDKSEFQIELRISLAFLTFALPTFLLSKALRHGLISRQGTSKACTSSLMNVDLWLLSSFHSFNQP